MVNPPVISAPVSRGTAARSTGCGVAQSYIAPPIPSEGADQALLSFFPSEGADQAYIGYGIPSEGASQSYIGYGIPSEGASF